MMVCLYPRHADEHRRKHGEHVGLDKCNQHFHTIHEDAEQHRQHHGPRLAGIIIVEQEGGVEHQKAVVGRLGHGGTQIKRKGRIGQGQQGHHQSGLGLGPAHQTENQRARAPAVYHHLRALR